VAAFKARLTAAVPGASRVRAEARGRAGAGGVGRRPAWPFWSRRLTAALYSLALTWALLAPASTFEGVGELFFWQDKVVHGALFMTLAFLVRWSLPAPASPAPGRFGCLAAVLLYAVTIEALQPALGGAGRRFEALDLACNIAGAGFGWLLCGLAAGYHFERGAR
jgi:hypothetical protein